MVQDQQDVDATEPSQAFTERCQRVISRWEGGDLPFKEAVAQLTIMGQEAAGGQPANHARAEQSLGYVQGVRGNLNASIQHFERARSLYQRAGNARRLAAIDLNLGENYRNKGEFARAIDLFRTARQAAEQHDMLNVRTLASSNEGLALMTIGHDDEAREALGRGLKLTEEWPTETERDVVARQRVQCEAHQGLAVIALREGDLTTAAEHAQATLALGNASSDPILIGLANRIAGDVVTQTGEPLEPDTSADPDDYFREALEAFRGLNAEAEMARTMYSQALSLAARGRATTAARKLQHVMILFSRLGMVDDANRAAQSQLEIT